MHNISSSLGFYLPEAFAEILRGKPEQFQLLQPFCQPVGLLVSLTNLSLR